MYKEIVFESPPAQPVKWTAEDEARLDAAINMIREKRLKKAEDEANRLRNSTDS